MKQYVNKKNVWAYMLKPLNEDPNGLLANNDEGYHGALLEIKANE